MIAVGAVAELRVPEHALLRGAELAERAVGAGVAHVDAHLDAVHAERSEQAVEQTARGLLEQAGAAELGGEHGGDADHGEGVVEGAHHHQADRRFGVAWDDGPAGGGAGVPMGVGAGDEGFHAGDCRRRGEGRAVAQVVAGRAP